MKQKTNQTNTISKKTSIQVRLLIIPILVVIISVGAIAAISSLMTRSSLIHQMKDNGHFTLEEVVSRTENNTNSLKAINDAIENNIINANKTMARDYENLSNERLLKLQKTLT